MSDAPAKKRPEAILGRPVTYSDATPLDQLVIDGRVAMRTCDADRAARMADAIRPTMRVIQPLIVATIDDTEGYVVFDGAGRYAGASKLKLASVPTAHIGTFKADDIPTARQYAVALSALLSVTTKPTLTMQIEAANAMIRLGAKPKTAGNALGLSESAIAQLMRVARLPAAARTAADEGRVKKTLVTELATRCGEGSKNAITPQEAAKIIALAADRATVDPETKAVLKPASPAAVKEVMKEVLGKRAEAKATSASVNSHAVKPRTYAQVKEYFENQTASRLFKASQILRLLTDSSYEPKEQGATRKPAPAVSE